MEHLPLPSEVKPFIRAPYEAPPSEWYNNEGLLSFPSTRNWTEFQLRGGDDTCNDAHLDPNGFHTKGIKDKVEQFFQTWLFFGLAIDVLKLGGVTATTEDFLQRQGVTKARIVDTSKLPEMLVDWGNGIKRRGNLRRDWKILSEMFEKAATVLDRFCAESDEPNASPLWQEKPRPWPVRDEISTTMIAMASMLRRAAINVCSAEIGSEIDSLPPWPVYARSEILTKRLRAKWCIADVTTMLNQLPVDGHYYLAGSPGLDAEELDHHAKCVREHCLYEYDPDLYITRHVTDDHCQEKIDYGGQLGPERGQRDWVDAVNRIIDKDAIPIALWNKGMRKMWSVEYHFSGKRRPDYVAISHVWADGKGNPNANSLPECQLDRIQRLVEKVQWHGRKEVPSNPKLSDGIGFWMDTLCIPVADKDRKNKAITNMRHVYSHAKAVLVLDDWLQSMRSDAQPLDMITRIYQSNWLKRLWTHQEGFLPQAVWFQFADQSVEIYDLRSKLEKHLSSLQVRGMHLGFPINANERLVQLYTFLTFAFKDMPDDKKWILYKPLAVAMSQRKTSRLADEVICLATIVDIPLKPFLEIASKPDAKSGQKRMARFLYELGRFDTGIIFNNYERLDDRGYRWAPRSLLNLRTARITYWGSDNHRETDSPFEVVNGQLGLLTRYHGFLVNFANGKPSFGALERGCAIQCIDSADMEMDIEGKWFIVQLPPNKVEWTTWRTYAVILSEIPGARRVSPAVVAAVEEGPTNGVYTVQHESIATVWVQDSSLAWVDSVQAPLLREDTGWLVV